MPIYIEISSLHRTVTIVARGSLSPDEIRGSAQQMFEARVPHYSKLVDVSGATSEFSLPQVEAIATLLRGRPEEKRGPVAFLVDPARGEFARAFADTQRGQRAVSLFTSLREAREWLARPHDLPDATPVPVTAVALPVADAPVAATPAAGTPWADPQRQAVMIRGTRRRDIPASRCNRGP